MTLCDNCQHMRFELPADSITLQNEVENIRKGRQQHAELPVYRLQSSFRDLKRSATKGCQFCALVLSSFADKVASKPDLENAPVWLQYFLLGEQPRRAGVEMLLYVHVNKEDVSLLGCRQDTTPITRYTPVDVATNMTTGSPINMQLAGKWLSDCLNQHHMCSSYQDGVGDTLLPARVIDVGSQSRAPHLRLSTAGERGSYAILSHCWGTLRFMTTTSVSVGELQTALPWDQLTNTFKESILVCRALSIPFLWIDSYCIIQDDSDDWNTESPKMGQYYRNATVSIAALHGANGQAGLFASRHPFSILPVDISLERPVDKNKDVDLIPSTGSKLETWRFTHNEVYWRDRNMDPPLETRGWTLQESVLPARTLCFGAFAMGWKCLHGEQSEDHPHERNPTRNWMTLFGRTDLVAKPDIALESTNGTSYPAWRRIISDYSKRSLTYDSDLLPALSGIASEVQRGNRDEYLVGCWKGDLLNDLLWSSIRSNQGRFKPPQVESAPTWSWASMKPGGAWYDNGCYSRPVEGRKPLASVVSVDVEYASSNKFGAVRRAVLQLHGRLMIQPPFRQTWYVYLDDASDREWLAKSTWVFPMGYVLQDQISKYESFSDRLLIEVLILVETGFAADQFRRIGRVSKFWSEFKDVEPSVISLV